MRRLCYVIPSLEVGGTERQLVQLMQGLADDFELTLVCTRREGTFIGEARRVGSYVHVLAGRSGWDFTLYRRLRKLFYRHRPDIVHSFMFGFDYAVNKAARATGTPVVLSSRRQLATWKKQRHIRLQQKANAMVDCVVANSEAVARFAAEQEKANPALYRVIYNGIDADEYKSDAPESDLRNRFRIPFNTHVIGMVANFSPVKDHDLFLATAEELMRRRSDVHFLLVGSGPERRKVERTIRRRRWPDRFTVTNALADVPDLLRLMTVSVLTSQNEGFPNALMESMAAGVPVAAPAVGGIPELVQHEQTGLLVESRKPVHFANAVETLLDDQEKRDTIADAAALAIRRGFSVEKMIHSYHNLYNELLAEGFRAEK